MRETEQPNALHSLYGGKTKRRRALAGNVGVRREDREQVVLTPEWLLRQLGPQESLYLDPCTTPENPCGAAYFYTEADNGLEKSWGGALGAPWWVYVNPPYAELRPWLEKAQAEAKAGARIRALVPHRTNRKWYCDGLEGGVVQTLEPFPFVGSKSNFPAPLAIVSFNMPALVRLVTTPTRTFPCGKELITRTWE